MFGLFKSKSKVEKLQDTYKKLQEEAFKLSKIDRAKSDAKQEEAAKILAQIEELEKKNS